MSTPCRIFHVTLNRNNEMLHKMGNAKQHRHNWLTPIYKIFTPVHNRGHTEPLISYIDNPCTIESQRSWMQEPPLWKFVKRIRKIYLTFCLYWFGIFCKYIFFKLRYSWTVLVMDCYYILKIKNCKWSVCFLAQFWSQQRICSCTCCLPSCASDQQPVRSVISVHSHRTYSISLLTVASIKMQRTDNVSLSGPLSLLHTNEETDQLKRLSPFPLSLPLCLFLSSVVPP